MQGFYSQFSLASLIYEGHVYSDDIVKGGEGQEGISPV